MENNAKQEKKHSRLVKLVKVVFVHNFTYKIFAVLFGALIWILTVGLFGNGVI